jgi:type III pantothenate kinase
VYDLSVISIGNTNTTIGYFLNDELLETKKKKTKKLHKTPTLLPSEKILLSSVVTSKNYLFQKKYPVTKEIKIKMINDFSFPDNIGIDRAINCFAVSALYQLRNFLVVDIGTALTFTCCLDKVFNGGMIIPGYGISKDALFRRTQLKNNNIKQLEFSLFEKETTRAINSGTSKLFSAGINLIIDEYLSQIPDLKVVLTGGDAFFFSKYIKNYNILNTTLLLEGMLRLSYLPSFA